MKYAWIENGTIRDIAHDDPAKIFAPEVAKLYNTLVPDDAANGDGWDGKVLTKPTPPEPPAPVAVDKLLTRIQFMLRFTPAERVAIKAKVADTNAPDAVLNDWWEILHDPQFEGVHTAATPFARQALLYLVSINLLEADRVDEVLA